MCEGVCRERRDTEGLRRSTRSNSFCHSVDSDVSVIQSAEQKLVLQLESAAEDAQATYHALNHAITLSHSISRCLIVSLYFTRISRCLVVSRTESRCLVVSLYFTLSRCLTLSRCPALSHCLVAVSLSHIISLDQALSV